MILRITSLAILILFLCQVISAAAPQPPQIEAKAAVIIDATTRRVLFGQNETKMMNPASTTKMMTLLVALELGDLDSVVTVSSHAAAVRGSTLGLMLGDKLTLRDLLTGMMLVSGNDAAEAVAETIGGSVSAFVKMMNARADKIGMVHTHFANPHGLTLSDHYSTALDLAQIAAVGLQNPEFANIISTKKFTVDFLNRSPKKVTNTNKLLNTFPGANGIKTGTTKEAGYCLVAGAKQGDVQLIVVVLNALSDDERWDDSAKLLEYGFQLSGAGS